MYISSVDNYVIHIPLQSCCHLLSIFCKWKSDMFQFMRMGPIKSYISKYSTESPPFMFVLRKTQEESNLQRD